MVSHPVVVALVALVPAAVTWWTGERLRRRLDDPALPELLMRRRSRIASVWGVTLVALIALDYRKAAWSVPLMLLAMIAAGHPAQRVMLQESWGLGAYLWHTLRRLAGSVAFWALVAFTPALVLAPDTTRGAYAVAAGLTVLLLVWERYYRRVWLAAFGATPLGARPALDERFAAVVAKSTAPPPRLYRFGAPGERAAGAYALPGVKGEGSVVFTDALLDLLTPEEVTAVFAHEVAHLEHYDARMLRRLRATTALLTLAVVALPLVARLVAPAAGAWMSLAGPAAVLVALVIRARRARAHETESDLRGAALCGDPEALVRALTKIHTALRLPRRWPEDVDRAATHPSLAHRIRTLREAAAAAATPAEGGAPPAPAHETLAAPAVVRSTRPGSWVAIAAGRLHLFDGVPESFTPSGDGAADLAALAAAAEGSRTLSYERLARLDLDESGRSAPRLVVSERGGQRLSLPLDPAGARAARAALDVVDVRLGRAEDAARHGAGPLPTVAAAALALVLLLVGQLGVLFVPAAIAVFHPSAAALAGFGAAAAVRAVLALSAPAAPLAGLDPRGGVAVLVAAALLGALCCWLALRLARESAAAAASADAGADDAARRRAVPATLALGVLALLYAAGAGWVGSALAATAAVPALHTLGALLVGLAAALAAQHELGRRRWWGAGASAAAAAAALVLASAGEGVASPPPLVAGPAARATVVRSARVAGAARGLDVSPSGRHFVVHRYAMGDEVAGEDFAAEDVSDEEYFDEGDPATARVQIGALGEGAAPPRELHALGAAFVSDEALLVLARHDSATGSVATDDSLVLRIERTSGMPASNDAWRVTVPRLVLPQLRVSGGGGRWSLTGRDPANPSAPMTLEGRVGGGEVTTRRWAAESSVRSLASALSPGLTTVIPLPAGGAVGVRFRALGGRTMALYALGITPVVSELWRMDDRGGRRRLAGVPGFLRCVDGAAVTAGQAGAPSALCTATDVRNNTTLLAVSADGRRVTTLASLEGMANPVAAGPSGRVLAGVPARRELVLLDPASRSSSRVMLPEDMPFAYEARWVTGGIALLVSGGRGAKVVLLDVQD